MFLFFILFVIFALISLAMPWWQRHEITNLQNEIKRIKEQLNSGKKAENFEETISAKLKTEKPLQNFDSEILPQEPTPIAEEESKISKPKISFEQRFGARLPVWIGGVALALSGVFLVKYSIETGLLTQNARLILAAIFGAGLIALGSWIKDSNKIANNVKIAQTLAGAAIVDLYACIYAATSIYEIFSPLVGFTAMAVVTIIAVFLSLNFGPAIAVFGLVGGFLTPALISSNEPSAAMLFIYLYLLSAGLFFVIRRQSWWIIAIPTIIAIFLWVALWLATSFVASDGFCLCLFLIAICATVTLISRQAIENGEVDKCCNFSLSIILSYLTLCGSALLLALIAKKTNFGILELSFFALLSAGSVFLAHFKQKIYGFAPIITAAVSAFILLSCNSLNPQELTAVILTFVTLFVICGYPLMWKSENPTAWAILVAAGSVGYYLIGYFKIYLPTASSNQSYWSISALLLALLTAKITKRIFDEFVTTSQIKQQLLAAFSLASSAFLSIAFLIEFEREFFPIFFAAQILAISVIDQKVEIKALRKIAIVNAVIFGALTLFAHLSASNALFYFGIPAIFLFAASQLFAKKADDLFVKYLEISAIILAVLASYKGLQAHGISFTTRAIFTDILCLLALFCLWFGERFSRRTIVLSAKALFGSAILRICFFDLAILNPLWSQQMVGSLPLINSLVLAYFLPAATLIFVNRNRLEPLLPLSRPFASVSILAFISLNIRQLFHGAFLNLGPTTDAETYSYSASWLLLGIAFLIFGTAKKNKAIRLSALGLIILAVCKVFLFDASELSGLYRVFSFLGLGIVLIGLSWFYSRFVSEEKQK